MRSVCTAGLYAASTIGLLALSGNIHLNAQMKTLPVSKLDKNGVPAATNYTTERNIKSLGYVTEEHSVDDTKFSADDLVQKAAL